MERTYRPSTVGKQRRGTAHTCVHLCPSETPGSRLGQVKRENRKPLLRALNNVGGGICSLFMENSPQFYVMFQLQVTRGQHPRGGSVLKEENFSFFPTNVCVLRGPTQSAVESGCRWPSRPCQGGRPAGGGLFTGLSICPAHGYSLMWIK